MVKPKEFIEVFQRANMEPFIGVPCSLLASLIKYLINNPAKMKYFNPPNEAHNLGLAAGFYLGNNKIPVVLLQNSGFGNIINPLTSLNQIYRIPVFLIITWRGYGGFGSDAPEHDIVGRDLEKYLKIFHLPYEILSEDNYKSQIIELKNIAKKEKVPVAAVIRKNFFPSHEPLIHIKTKNGLQRYKAIKIIKESLTDYIFLSTTGFISRESFAIKNTSDFYMVGSMGLISAIGCGGALAQKEKKIAIFDGDGAILMHFGLIPFIGRYKPQKFLHFILDNGVYASTQNQPTVSPSVEFDKIALSSGYRHAYKVSSPEKLKSLLKSIKNLRGPVLVWVKVVPGNKKRIGRVSVPPEKIKSDFMEAIRKNYKCAK